MTGSWSAIFVPSSGKPQLQENSLKSQQVAAQREKV
jgi:hypothetical protein